jgi:beta-lactam-binding protein with PASTA domain
MPKVTGMGLNKAILLFEKNGLKVGKVQYRSYPNVSRGVVVKQFPEPGHPLMEKSPMNLEVAR